jgi:hypothetical protein
LLGFSLAEIPVARFIQGMSEGYQIPRSARDELDGIVYLPRLCDKIRKHHAGILHPEFHANLGLGMDLWTCQFLGVDYNDLKAQVIAGATDEDALNWARENGVTRPDYEKAWFLAYMKTRGFRDDLSKRLAERKKEDPHTDRDDILSFMDYIEVDEGRSL